MDKIIKIIFALLLLTTVEISAASLPSTPAGSTASEENTGWYSNTTETAPMQEAQYSLTVGSLVPVAAPPGYWTHPTIEFFLGDTLNFTDIGESYRLILSGDEPGYLWIEGLTAGDVSLGTTDYFLEAEVPVGNEIWMLTFIGSLYGAHLIRKRRRKNKE